MAGYFDGDGACLRAHKSDGHERVEMKGPSLLACRKGRRYPEIGISMLS